MAKYTKKAHERYLDMLYDDLGEDEIRRQFEHKPPMLRLALKGKAGQAMRKYDPIAFNVSYQDAKNYQYYKEHMEVK